MNRTVWLACVVLVMAGCGRGFEPVDEPFGSFDGGFGGGSGSSSARCVPGRVETCPCLGSSQPGIQTCLATGVFASCQCVGATGGGNGFTGGGSGFTGGGFGSTGGGFGNTGGGFGGTGGGFTSAGGGGGFLAPVDGGVVITSGTDTLVDFFPVPAGVIVVRSTAVQLLDANGQQLAQVTSVREITAAAFDGTLLGVADRAILTVYDANLNALRSVNLIESCASAVIVSSARFVCGPANDWDRIFSVFDLNTATLMRRGPEKYTYNGIPMRLVPGTDDFVTVTTSSSPSDFHLYRTLTGTVTDGGVMFMGESPYHGDFAATTSYAFDQSPAQHLITSEGLMLRIYLANCKPNTGYQGACFERNGELGTLPNNKMYLSMTEGVSGTVYGIVDQGSSNSYFDPDCENGCAAQRIDVAARVVRGQTNFTAKVERVIGLRYDPWRSKLLFGYLEPGASYGQTGAYRLISLAP
ncbi:MAG: hypothetical protein ACO1OB_19625 [Archangium sp.]